METSPTSIEGSKPGAAGGAGAAAAGGEWTTRRLLTWMTGHFTARGLDSPRVVAEMLLAHVLGCDRLHLYMDADRPASAAERDRLRALVARASDHQPVQYLVGEANFYCRSLRVDDSTLIPQPSTEALVEAVLEAARGRPGPDLLIADIGTGSGCIAVTLAALLPQATVLATDIVPGALALAADNAARHGVAARIEFRAGAALEPLRAFSAERGRSFDVICSNPPYVSDQEIAGMDECVRRHVPRSAWWGGEDGLDVIRPIIEGARPLLAPAGALLVEIADRHRDAVLDLARRAGFESAEVVRDHEGFWRVLIAQA